MRKSLVIVLLMGACLGNAQAQFHLKAKIQNNHLWRGMEVSDGVVLLTDLSYTMAHDHVTVGLWGRHQLGRFLQGVQPLPQPQGWRMESRPLGHLQLLAWCQL